GSDMYVSDGEAGKIWKISIGGTSTVYAAGLDTPSAIAFDPTGGLMVADAGANTIDRINANGQVTVIAGIKGNAGFADGDAMSAQFNGPIGVAVGSDGRIFVADTYNDRIRVIENGRVTTLAGSNWGFADGPGADAKFFTPCGLAIFQDKLLVADTGNGRIRVIESDGMTWTLAGTGDGGLKNGFLASSS